MMLKITKIQESRRDVSSSSKEKSRISGPPSWMENAGRISSRRKPCIWTVPMSISSMPREWRS